MNQNFENNLDGGLNPDPEPKNDFSNPESNLGGEINLENNASASAPDSTSNNLENIPSTPSQNLNNIGPATISEPNFPPVSPRRNLWKWFLGIFLVIILILGGAAFASWKGWIPIGLGEIIGGVSGNPYKAPVQAIAKIQDIQELEYDSDIDVKLRVSESSPKESPNISQTSYSATAVKKITDLVMLPAKISKPSLSTKVLGESTSKTSMNFQMGFAGKATQEAVSFQYHYKLTDDTSMQIFEEYLKPFADSKKEIIFNFVSDLENNNLYFKVSSLKAEKNPWIKISIPKKNMPKDQQTFKDVMEEFGKKFAKITIKDYKDLFKKAKNLGIEKINGNWAYHFVYVTSAKRLTEFSKKLDKNGILDSSSGVTLEKEDFDMEIGLWIGAFDQKLYKFSYNTTTKDSQSGSMTLNTQTTLGYKNITVDIPQDKDTIGSICKSALAEVGIIKELCADPMYSSMLNAYSSGSDTNTDSAASRDSQRKSDLRSLQTALELYFDENNKYPISTSPSRTNDANGIIVQALKKYLTDMPVDPKNPDWYYAYKSDTAGSSYELTCLLEAPSDPENYQKVGEGYLYKLSSK